MRVSPATGSACNISGNIPVGVQRQSNIELLRIVAMIMVMMLHANFAAFGVPDTRGVAGMQLLPIWMRVMAETSSAVSVSLFVLVSGWFGIRSSLKGLLKLLFQCVFFFSLTYIVMTEVSAYSWTGIGSCLMLGTSNWFVKAYLGLYILAPMLNTFVEHTKKRMLRNIIILFFVYQTIWGWIGANTSVNDGYSAFSFIGLYLLARYLRIYKSGINGKRGLGLYVIMACVNTAMFFMPDCGIKAISYANPFLIAGAAGLFIWFTELRIRINRMINFIASAAFGAYLLHTSPAVMIHYLNSIRGCMGVDGGILGILAICGVIIGFYAGAIVIDIVRARCWSLLSSRSLITPYKSQSV